MSHVERDLQGFSWVPAQSLTAVRSRRADMHTNHLHNKR